ncbi:uncharacterized protein Bfra_006897 [Botrytis fragariae]|uniref:2EXR domain-containing protein n=1 Tax=Botrytis fragariae TaxID=1964551 RepID=A0A8H6EPQ9_9HELO|nr:uncharacterized protein Bfra_006897 [Botrytis fragariae]KAF5879690.1 hypothetical protein Bfra_006897 [Botrytis fragariae]
MVNTATFPSYHFGEEPALSTLRPPLLTFVAIGFSHTPSLLIKIRANIKGRIANSQSSSLISTYLFSSNKFDFISNLKSLGRSYRPSEPSICPFYRHRRYNIKSSSSKYHLASISALYLIDYANLLSSNNMSWFASMPLASVADFENAAWLDLALTRKFVGEKPLMQLNWLDLEVKSVRYKPLGQNIAVVQAVARKQVATSFSLFPELATELQNKIWVMASLRCSRFISIVEENVDVATHPDDDQYRVIGATRPRLLYTCKGAVSAMVGIYRPMFQLDASKYHGTKKGVMVNPDIDIIDFVSLLNFQTPPLDFVGALLNPGELYMVRHICLPMQEFHDNFQAVARIIRNLPLLESVVVETDQVDLTLSDTLHIKFVFADICYARPGRSPRTEMTIMVMHGGFHFIGAQAISILFNDVTNLTHQAGILESLAKMNLMMRQEANFPDKIFASFNYRNS